jgi:outer membrane protein TolC
VRAAVVSAQQNSLTNAKLVPVARQQLDAAQTALALAQTNLRAGTMLTVDVLQAEDTAAQARLRYVDAVIHYNQAQVDLLAALGLLTTDVVAAAPTTQP